MDFNNELKDYIVLDEEDFYMKTNIKLSYVDGSTCLNTIKSFNNYIFNVILKIENYDEIKKEYVINNNENNK